MIKGWVGKDIEDMIKGWVGKDIEGYDQRVGR
jgi:hypothetical protein